MRVQRSRGARMAEFGRKRLVRISVIISKKQPPATPWLGLWPPMQTVVSLTIPKAVRAWTLLVIGTTTVISC